MVIRPYQKSSVLVKIQNDIITYYLRSSNFTYSPVEKQRSQGGQI